MNYKIDDFSNKDMSFHLSDQEIIRFCENGDILVKGNLIENDKELVNAMREFLGLPDKTKLVGSGS